MKDIDHQTSTDRKTDLTTRNAKTSPLLRLPAELRNQVYRYIYNARIINVDARHRPGSLDRESIPGGNWRRLHGPHRLEFFLCCPADAEHGTICNHLYPSISHSGPLVEWQPCPHARPLTILPPSVCTQFVHEALDVLCQPSTWVFHSQHDFALFTRLYTRITHRIGSLVFRAPGTETLKAFCRNWRDALTWRLLSPFSSLRSVRIEIDLLYDRGNLLARSNLRTDTRFGTKGEVSPAGGMWVKAGLLRMARALAQWRLEEVDVKIRLVFGGMNRVLGDYVTLDTEGWEEGVKELLLQYVPLGLGSSGRERKWVRARSTAAGRKGSRSRNGLVDGGNKVESVAREITCVRR
ncbi:Nn.00g024640.m01.CDS01 [Neocucurbitaria sp. VM-36]